MIIDSHCHIYDEKLNDVRNEIMQNLKKNNQVVLCCADNLKNSKKCVDLAIESKNIFAGVGVHPECVEEFDEKTIKNLEHLLQNKKVVAVGEIGLDYHYDKEIENKAIKNGIIDEDNIKKEIEKNHNKQKEALISQIKLAKSLDYPCIFHVRDCTGDFLDVLKTLKDDSKEKDFKIKGVVHSFSGSLEVAQIYLKYGLYFGVNGVITFKNARNLVEVIKNLPLEKLLIETDCPYLTPEPFRGKINRPEYVKFVAEKIADIKGLNVEEVVNTTTQNAKKLFNLNF